MSTIKKYYDELWQQKSGKKPYQGRERSALRNALSNFLMDPEKDSRAFVAKEMIGDASGKLLDIGCWGGAALKTMGVLEKFDEVYGVDLIDESVQKAKALGIKCTSCDLNIDSLPYPDKTFEVVTCLAVIGQVFDPYHVLREIHRVLKTDGLVIINVPNVASMANRIRILFGRIPVTSGDPGWDGGQLHYFTLYDTKKALEENGFSVIDIQATGPGRKVRKYYPSLLGGALTFKAKKI
jgi:SAM-dependent methyltransferase